MRSRWFALAVLAVFVVAAAIGVWLTARSLPGEPVREEILRASVQILIVAVVGVAVTMLTFTLQQNRLDRVRSDERLQTVFAATVNAYNQVKQIRRVLKAETQMGDRREIDVDTYTRLMTELSKQQLIFEDLKRSAVLVEHALPRTVTVQYENDNRHTKATLQSLFRIIEKYLNTLVDDYETTRHLAVAAGRVSLDEPGMVRLKEFIEDSEHLLSKITAPVHGVLNAIEKAQLTSART